MADLTITELQEDTTLTGTEEIPIWDSGTTKKATLDAVKTFVGASAGVSDHGALTGLGDDDHPHYFNDTRGDARYSQLGHNHSGVYEPAGTAATAVSGHLISYDHTLLHAPGSDNQDLSGYSLTSHTHTDLHSHTNKTTLDKITEAAGEPLWNGSAWPGGGVSSTTYTDAGVIVTPSFTDNGNGSVTIGSGEYVLFTDINTYPPQRYTITGNTFALSDGTLNYITASYNSGTPIIKSSTSRADIDQLTVIPLYSIYRTGNTLVYLDWDKFAVGLANKLADRLVRTERFAVEPGGLALGETAGRVVTITSGNVWSGGNRIDSASYASDTDLFYQFSHIAGVWQKQQVSTYNNTQYDNGTALATLSNGRYAVNWIIKRVAEPLGCACLVLGQGDYTLVQAQASTVPVLPPEVSSLGVVVGRIIVEKGATTATQIDSAFTTQFQITASGDHSQLSNLQGGTTDEYYHLTNAQITDVANLDTAAFQPATAFAASSHIHAQSDVTDLVTDLAGKQATLVSGTNIKTINSQSLLGSGDIVISGSGMTNPMTAAGDIIIGGTAGVPERLAKGTDGQVLTLASGLPAWGTAASGGGSLLVAETIVTGSPVTSVTFSGLDINAAGGYDITLQFKTTDNTNKQLELYINGLMTSTLYYSQIFMAWANTSYVGNANSPRLTPVSLVPQISTINLMTSDNLAFALYSGTFSHNEASYIIQNVWNHTLNVTNITSVTLTTNAGYANIAVGSVFRLYKRK